MPASAPDTLWLATRDAQDSGWLALDLQAPARVVSFAEARRPPTTIGVGLLVGTVEAGLAATTASGGLAVSSALLRSLLAPRRVAHWGDLLAAAGEGPGGSERGPGGATGGDLENLGARELSDPEERLRREASLAWGLLATWAAYPEVLRGRIAAILDRTTPAQGRVVALLDRLAERRDRSPFAGWSQDEGVAVSLVEEPEVAPEGRIPGEAPPADAEGLQRWMQTAEGLGALFSSSFAPRQEQAMMAGEVTRALAERRALLVEAGTGVGKTLAYLVPLLVLLGAGDRRAVVATHTRALQSQILLHDWPRLAGLVPHLKVRPLMGRGNYLCRRSRDTFLAAAAASPEEAARQVALLTWLARTDTGEREELEHHPLLAASLRTLFETAAPCSPRVCYERKGGDICHVQRARRRAREADLLVVNHALLLQDLRAERAVIGPYDHLVIDEAHRLPAAALATWSVRCDRGRTEALVELAGGSRRKGEAPERVRLVALRLQERAGGDAAAAACADLGLRLAGVHAAHAAWWRSLDGLAAGLHGTDRVPGGTLRIRDKDVAFAPLRSETAALLESLAAARSALARLGEGSAALGEIEGVLEDELALLAQCGPLLEGLGEDLRRVTADPDDRWVTWSDPTARGGVRAVGATPLFAGELLREAWLGAGLAPVATSATLAVSGDFAHLLAELGLDKRRPPTSTRQVFSPFDFATQARFVAPDPELFPGPDEAGYAVAVAGVLLALARATPRRTMALFTSYRLLDAVARRLREEDGDLFAPEAHEGVVLLTQQGSGGTAELARRFRYHPRALLLGTSTFWEGVDFPGEELEILVVTKLPFRVPTDPWVEARCDWLQAQGENPFASFMVRDAVLRLRQGIGRLLRRQDDRGLVVLLDTRLHRREYGVTFLDALPGPCAYFRDAADLAGQARSFFATA